MNRWHQITQLFADALNMDEAGRQAWLEKACGGDAGLINEVNSLLQAYTSTGLGHLNQDVSGIRSSALEWLGMQNKKGKMIGRYRIGEIAGAGGMGVVYRARDTLLDRDVAIKLPPAAWSRDERTKKRFLHEARAAASLDHPNICTIYEAGELDDGTLYMAMAFYEGETLHLRLERGPLSPVDAVKIALETAKGLEAAHQNGLVHRDIKPANLMITRGGTLKILDFGIARAGAQASGSGITQADRHPGTEAYMAPEQARGGEIDGRADLWSLGVVLYEMITGKRPQEDRLGAPSIHQSGIPADVAELIFRLLEPDPAHRFRNAAEAIAALEAGLQQTQKNRQQSNPPPQSSHPESQSQLSQPQPEPQPEPQPQSEPEPEPQPEINRRLILSGLILLIAAAGLGSYLFFGMPAARISAESDRPVTLAVLPFTNMSGDPGDEYFSDGITEELLTYLSRNSGFRVVSRSSVMRYRNSGIGIESGNYNGDDSGSGSNYRSSAGSDDVSSTGSNTGSDAGSDNNSGRVSGSVSENGSNRGSNGGSGSGSGSGNATGIESRRNIAGIGDELGATHLVGGSVRRDGDRVRITARLIDAQTDHQLWAGQYDRELRDIFAIQTDIARLIAEKLEGHLLTAAAFTEPPPIDPAAHDHYLRGRYFWHRRSESGLRSAADHFEKAVAIEPGYSAAWEGIADALAVLGFYDYLPPDQSFPRAREAARRALEIDPGSASAWASLGYVALYYDWNPEWSEAAFRRSINLDPGSSKARQWYANLLTASGRFDEAVREMTRAQELDPLSLIANAALGFVYYHAGRHEEAVGHLRLTLELDPGFELAYLWSGWSLESLQRYDEARIMYEESVARSGGSGISIAALARLHALTGNTQTADSLLNALTSSGNYVPSYEISKACLALNRPGLAAQWLERAIDERSHSMVFLRVDPQISSWLNEAPFDALAARVRPRE